MKKILIIVLILSGSAQADIFDTVGTFIGNSLEITAIPIARPGL
jgi:hypothetical protein